MEFPGPPFGYLWIVTDILVGFVAISSSDSPTHYPSIEIVDPYGVNLVTWSGVPPLNASLPWAGRVAIPYLEEGEFVVSGQYYVFGFVATGFELSTP